MDTEKLIYCKLPSPTRIRDNLLKNHFCFWNNFSKVQSQTKVFKFNFQFYWHFFSSKIQFWMITESKIIFKKSLSKLLKNLDMLIGASAIFDDIHLSTFHTSSYLEASSRGNSLCSIGWMCLHVRQVVLQISHTSIRRPQIYHRKLKVEEKIIWVK